MQTRRGFLCLAAALAGMSLIQPAFAQVGGDLNIAPKRLVLDASARSATVFIFNRGATAATYDIGLVDRIMTQDGQISAVDQIKPGSPEAALAAGLRSAKDMVTHTPRRVTLQPGESQTVKLRILRPADLTAGEYRTHLTVTAVPPEDAGLTAEQAAGDKGGQLGAKVVSLFAISIPIIVRQGAPDVRAAIANVRYTADTPSLTLDLQRQGGNSLYGDIEIRIAGAPASAAPLGILRGIAVYPETAQRELAIPLPRKLAAGEKIELVFRDGDLTPGQTLATSELTVR